MPKTSSQCLTNLLSDDGMKVEELFARASVDETSENVRKESTRLSSYAMQHIYLRLDNYIFVLFALKNSIQYISKIYMQTL